VVLLLDHNAEHRTHVVHFALVDPHGDGVSEIGHLNNATGGSRESMRCFPKVNSYYRDFFLSATPQALCHMAVRSSFATVVDLNWLHLGLSCACLVYLQ